MKCDRCDKPAVVHEVTVKGGAKNEVHLCEDCAAAAGIAIPGHQPINKLLTQFMVSSPKQASAPGKPNACPTCGLTFQEFRKHGTLGCSDCYATFGDGLAKLIERAQNDATHHTGKAPHRAGGSIDRQAIIQRLLRELDDAVSAEQYERAAALRDQLKSVEEGGPVEGVVDEGSDSAIQDVDGGSLA